MLESHVCTQAPAEVYMSHSFVIVGSTVDVLNSPAVVQVFVVALAFRLGWCVGHRFWLISAYLFLRIVAHSEQHTTMTLGRLLG